MIRMTGKITSSVRLPSVMGVDQCTDDAPPRLRALQRSRLVDLASLQYRFRRVYGRIRADIRRQQCPRRSVRCGDAQIGGIQGGDFRLLEEVEEASRQRLLRGAGRYRQAIDPEQRALFGHYVAPGLAINPFDFVEHLL